MIQRRPTLSDQILYRQEKNLTQKDTPIKTSSTLEKIIQKEEKVLSEMKDIVEQREEFIQQTSHSPPYANSTSQIVEHKEEERKFDNLVVEGQKPLMIIRSVFPLDLFPDTLIIDPIKVTQIHRIFFASNQIKSITIKDIKFVIIENAPFLATLRISDNMLQPTIFVIKPLWKKHAKEAHDIIQGLIQSSKQNIDTTKITPAKQIAQLEKLGKIQE